MKLLNPYLHFNGQCEEAFNFYAKVLGGEIVAMMPHKGTPAEEHVPAEWRNKIIHARLIVGDKLLSYGLAYEHAQRLSGASSILEFG